MTKCALSLRARRDRRGSPHVLADAAVEEAAEERGEAAAVVGVGAVRVGVGVGIGGARVAAAVARDARDGLGGRGLDKGEAGLVVERGGEGHLARAALLPVPRGEEVVLVVVLVGGGGGDGLLPEPEEAAARRLLLAGGGTREVEGARGGTRGAGGAADLLAGDFDDVWLRVGAGGAGGVEGVRGGPYEGGGKGGGREHTGLWHGGSTRAGGDCGNDWELLFLERWEEGRMLDAARGGRKEEAESTLGRRMLMIAGILDWGYRSEMDSHVVSTRDGFCRSVRHRIRTAAVENEQRAHGSTLARSRPGDGSPRRVARSAAGGRRATRARAQRHPRPGAVAAFRGRDRRATSSAARTHSRTSPL